MILRVALLALILLAGSAHAANKFVRAGAGGSGTGADWTNAYTTLPASLTRGDTYYVADGTYSGSYLFDDANSGSTLITIKKCSTSDGVSSGVAGYSSAYCDGQASFTGSFNFSTDYYVIDGSYRNESSWSDGSAYGIRVNGVETNYSAWGHASDNITLKYLDIGPDNGTTNLEAYGGALIYIGGFSETAENWTIQRNYIHNGRALGQMAGAHNFLWEYNWFAKNWEKTGIRHQIRGSSMVYRYNVFRNTCQGNSFDPGATSCTAIIGWYGNAGSNGEDYSYSKVYGNVFIDTVGTVFYSDATLWFGDDRTSQGGGPQDCSYCDAYNNTFVGMGANNVDGVVGIFYTGTKTGSQARNNLFFDIGANDPGCSAATCSNNYEVSDVFVNDTTEDFRLASDGAAGTGYTLSSPYNADMNGVTRGSGTWDVGAFEYSTGSLLPGPGNPRWRPADAWPLWFAWWGR